MRRLAVTALLLLAAAAGSVRAEQPGAAPRTFSPEGLAKVSDYIRNEVATGKIAGAILLIQQHGKPVYSECFGVRDVVGQRPMTPHQHGKRQGPATGHAGEHTPSQDRMARRRRDRRGQMSRVRRIKRDREQQPDPHAGQRFDRDRERRGRSRRDPLVRVRDAAVHGEVAGHTPDDEEHDEDEQRDQRPAPPRPSLLPAHDSAVAALVRLVAPGERHFPLLSTALVDAVRLLPGGGHPAGYGTRSR